MLAPESAAPPSTGQIQAPKLTKKRDHQSRHDGSWPPLALTGLAHPSVVGGQWANHSRADDFVGQASPPVDPLRDPEPVSYTHLRAHETPEHLVCRLLLEKKKKKTSHT